MGRFYLAILISLDIQNKIYQKVYSDYIIMRRRENVINFLDEIKQEYEVIINPDLTFD